jgi:GntR family transcriptional regulator
LGEKLTECIAGFGLRMNNQVVSLDIETYGRPCLKMQQIEDRWRNRQHDGPADLTQVGYMHELLELYKNITNAARLGSRLAKLLCTAVSLLKYSVSMFLRLAPNTGQPLYLQLMQQIRHAAESGALRDGDQLPGIRTLAEELVVSPNTVAKAYSELEHEGLLEMRHGSGAFVSLNRRGRSLADHVSQARRRARKLIDELRDEGLHDDEIRRVFEAEMLQARDLVRRI